MKSFPHRRAFRAPSVLKRDRDCRLQRACRAIRLVLPASAGGLLFGSAAMAQTYDPFVSDIQIIHTPGVGASQSIFSAPYTHLNVPGATTGLPAGFAPYATPAGDLLAPHVIYTGTPPASVYQLNSTYNSTPPTGPAQSIADASVGESGGGGGNTDVVLGAGTGVTQTNPAGAYPYASDLTLDVNHLTYQISKLPTLFGFPTITYAFPVGGLLAVGGTVNFDVNLTYYYYPTSAASTKFTFSSTQSNTATTIGSAQTITGQNLGSINISETFSNTLATAQAFTSGNAGALLLNGGVAIANPGYIDVVGTVSFQSIIDSPPGGGGGPTILPTGGSNSWTPAPSPSSFELYLTAPATVAPGNGPGNSFLESSSPNLSVASSWTDTTGGPAGVPGTSDIAMFNSSSVGTAGTFTFGPPTGWGGISVMGSGVAVKLSQGAISSPLSIGGFGITVGPDSNGHSRDLIITVPVTTTASQTWSVTGAQTLSITGTTLSLGANTVSVTGAGNVNISANISGSGGLVMGGSGMMSLSGSDSFTGGTVLNGGEVSVASDSNLGGPTTPITFNGGILQVTGTSLTSINSHGVNWNSFSGGFDIINPADTFSISASIGNAAINSGSLTKLGAGTLVLAATNTYAGPTTISGGALVLNASNTLNPQSVITINSARGLALGSFVSVANPIVVDTTGGEFMQFQLASQEAALIGPITTGPGGQFNLGFPNPTDTLIVSGNVSLNQPATISEGTIEFVSNGSLTANAGTGLPVVLGNTANPLNLTVMNLASIANLGNGGISVGGGGPTGATTITVQDTASINAGTGNFELNQTTASNAVTTLNLNGGTVTAGGFTVTPAAGAAASATSIINFNGGVLTASANNANFLPSTTVGTVQLNVGTGGAIINTNGFDITVNTPAGFSKTVQLDGGLTKEGSGALVFGANFGLSGNASNVIQGPVTANGGLLEIGNINQFNFASDIMANAGGAVGYDGGSTGQFFYSILSASAEEVGPQTGGLALAPSDANTNIDYTGGVSGAFEMAGITTMSIGAVSAGVTYRGTITPTSPSSDGGLPQYELGGGGTLTLPLTNAGSVPLVDNGAKTSVRVENGGVVSLLTTNTYSGGTTILGMLIPDNPITGATELETTTLQVSNLANGTNSLGNYNHALPQNIFIDGGTLQYVGPTVAGTFTFLIGPMGATLDSSGSGTWTIQGAGTQTFSPAATGAVVMTLTGTALGANTFGTSLNNGPGVILGLVKSGQGSWTLAGSNSYTGPTSVNGGLLQLASTTALGNTSNLTVAGGGTLDLHGINFSVPSLNGGGVLENLVNGSHSTLILNGNQNSAFSGNLVNGLGTLALNKQGTGTIVLSGSNTFTGGTTILAGEVSISAASNIGPSVNVNGGDLQITGTTLNNLNGTTVNWAGFNGGLDITDPGNIFTVSNNITGSGSLTKLGAGTLSLTGTNTYSGGTFIQGGTVLVPNLSALGTGPLANNGSLLFTAPTGGNLTSNLSGSGGLTVSGPTTVTGSNSYTGSTNINSGATLTLANTNSLPSGGLVNNFGGLVVSATTTAGTITGDGGTTVNAGITLNTSGYVQDGLVNNGVTIIGCGGTVGFISGNGALTLGTPVMIGDLQIAPGGTGNTQTSLNVLGGSTLDITNNKVVLNYGSAALDPVTAISADIFGGYNGGTWAGTGITSTLAMQNPTKFAVGYLDGDRADDLTGSHVAANQIIIKYTLAGDAFLENSVGFDDLVVVAQNFGKTGEDWAGGNFNYSSNGTVGFADLVVVAQNFGQTTGLGDGAAGSGLSPLWQGRAPEIDSTSAVPEPSTFALAAAIFGGVLARRSRRSVSKW